MTTTETTIDLATIQAVSRLIVERFDPEKVILFGSYARGEPGLHSDVDLLVVLKATDRPARQGNPIRRAIAESYVLPVDVIVRTAEAVEKYRNDPYSLVHQALTEGVVLYERSAA